MDSSVPLEKARRIVGEEGRALVADIAQLAADFAKFEKAVAVSCLIANVGRATCRANRRKSGRASAQNRC